MQGSNFGWITLHSCHFHLSVLQPLWVEQADITKYWNLYIIIIQMKTLLPLSWYQLYVQTRSQKSPAKMLFSFELHFKRHVILLSLYKYSDNTEPTGTTYTTITVLNTVPAKEEGSVIFKIHLCQSHLEILHSTELSTRPVFWMIYLCCKSIWKDIN